MGMDCTTDGWKTPSRSWYPWTAILMSTQKTAVAVMKLSSIPSALPTPESPMERRLRMKRSDERCFTHASCIYTVRLYWRDCSA
eukprot:scaffold244417_cov27-Tisochrysis_lutea.AAC.1